MFFTTQHGRQGTGHSDEISWKQRLDATHGEIKGSRSCVGGSNRGVGIVPSQSEQQSSAGDRPAGERGGLPRGGGDTRGDHSCWDERGNRLHGRQGSARLSGGGREAVTYVQGMSESVHMWVVDIEPQGIDTTPQVSCQWRSLVKDLFWRVCPLQGYSAYIPEMFPSLLPMSISFVMPGHKDEERSTIRGGSIQTDC